MLQEIKQRVPSNSAQPVTRKGTLLGVVVDLSGSMQANLKNDQGGQYSRIESLSKAFQRAIEHIERLLESPTSGDSGTAKAIRLRIWLLRPWTADVRCSCSFKTSQEKGEPLQTIECPNWKYGFQR